MNHCPDTTFLQDYLDAELVPAEREAFEAHLAGCGFCQAELAAWRPVFARLGAISLWDPSPELADRVLAEIMPRHAGRWSRALGWAYGGGVAASLAALAGALFLPAPRAWMQTLAADATRAVVHSFVFVMKSCNAAILEMVDAFGASGVIAARLAPLVKALFVPLSHPAIVFTVWAAALVCAAVLWWMRPRESRSVRGSHHVGLLGL